MGVTVTVVDKASPILGRLSGPVFEAAVGRISIAVGEQVKTGMMRYPGGAASPVRWASAKQRRAYFAKRREAGLPMKYTRISDPMSQRLKQSWTVARRERMGAVVGTKATYAPFVQSEGGQSAQHAATGWVTDRQAVDEVVASGVIERIAEQVVRGLVGG